ncbi:unnamed protein product (mitochondrion) [Plasmodiophora brassicae]|uniref:Uncharacterized protein n=1 Tax=Plasmodiophora brassicae TaxID=37360 RepID=A0A3P3YJ58_PLABS|nr:unnamed protein product [Plasmodiophora brassicae]
MIFWSLGVLNVLRQIRTTMRSRRPSACCCAAAKATDDVRRTWPAGVQGVGQRVGETVHGPSASWTMTLQQEAVEAQLRASDKFKKLATEQEGHDAIVEARYKVPGPINKNVFDRFRGLARAHGLPDEVAHREHVRTCFGKKPGQETARADHQDELDYMYSTWPDDERFTRPRLDMKEDPHLERDVLDLNDDDKFKVVESDIMVEAAGRRPSGRFCTTMTKVIAAYESRVKPGGLLPGEVALPGEDRNVDNDKHRFADRMFRFQTDLVTVDDNARPAQVALRKWRAHQIVEHRRAHAIRAIRCSALKARPGEPLVVGPLGRTVCKRAGAPVAGRIKQAFLRKPDRKVVAGL